MAAVPLGEGRAFRPIPRANQCAAIDRPQPARATRIELRITRNARRPGRLKDGGRDGGRTSADGRRRAQARIARFLAVFGPGLVVMLADTDVGSVITAGQSGVQWGYRLLLLQLVLVPDPLHGAGTDRPAGHLHRPRPRRADPRHVRPVLGLGLRHRPGHRHRRRAADRVLRRRRRRRTVWPAARSPRCRSPPSRLLAVVFTGSYRRVERVAITVGLFELAFFFVAWAAHPDPAALLAGSLDIPYANKDYLYLAAANIGAVVMPWMIFYQQSAIADKRLRPEHLHRGALGYRDRRGDHPACHGGGADRLRRDHRPRQSERLADHRSAT